MGLRIVKTLINEVVKIKKEKIWEHYTVVENHTAEDKHLKKWIQVIIRSLPMSPAPSQPGNQGQGNDMR